MKIIFNILLTAGWFTMAPDGWGYDFTKSPKSKEFFQPASIEFTRDKKGVRIFGQIEPGLKSQFKKKVAKNVISFVILTSPGGDIRAAMALGKFINKLGLNTIASQFCPSACSVAFIYGKHRAIVRGSKLGFHRFSYENKNFEEHLQLKLNTTQYRIGKVYKNFGVTDEFVEQMFKAKNTGMWYPSIGELRNSNIIHEQISDARFPY